MRSTLLLLLLVFSFSSVFATVDTTKHHSHHYRNTQMGAGYCKVVSNDTVRLNEGSVTVNDSTSDITKLYIEFPSHPYDNEWKGIMIYPHIDSLYFVNGALDYPITKANKLTFIRFHYESADNKWHWYHANPIYYKGKNATQ